MQQVFSIICGLRHVHVVYLDFLFAFMSHQQTKGLKLPAVQAQK
jgi:hypothetical protein